MMRRRVLFPLIALALATGPGVGAQESAERDALQVFDAVQRAGDLGKLTQLPPPAPGCESTATPSKPVAGASRFEFTRCCGLVDKNALPPAPKGGLLLLRCDPAKPESCARFAERFGIEVPTPFASPTPPPSDEKKPPRFVETYLGAKLGNDNSLMSPLIGVPYALSRKRDGDDDNLTHFAQIDLGAVDKKGNRTQLLLSTGLKTRAWKDSETESYLVNHGVTPVDFEYVDGDGNSQQSRTYQLPGDKPGESHSLSEAFRASLGLQTDKPYYPVSYRVEDTVTLLRDNALAGNLFYYEWGGSLSRIKTQHHSSWDGAGQQKRWHETLYPYVGSEMISLFVQMPDEKPDRYAAIGHLAAGTQKLLFADTRCPLRLMASASGHASSETWFQASAEAGAEANLRIAGKTLQLTGSRIVSTDQKGSTRLSFTLSGERYSLYSAVNSRPNQPQFQGMMRANDGDPWFEFGLRFTRRSKPAAK